MILTVIIAIAGLTFVIYHLIGLAIDKKEK